MMEITEQSLRDTGWELHIFPDAYIKHITPPIRLFAELMKSGASISMFFARNSGIPLPNVRTMEALSLLEHLLSDNPAYTIVDTAPIDAAIAAQFPPGQATCERQ